MVPAPFVRTGDTTEEPGMNSHTAYGGELPTGSVLVVKELYISQPSGRVVEEVNANHGMAGGPVQASKFCL